MADLDASAANTATALSNHDLGGGSTQASAATAPSVAAHYPDAPPNNAPSVSFPGARRPDRRWWLNNHGLRLAVSEWGEPDAPPILFAHGGFDFAGTYDVFAPLIADGGWRVVSWDQRGHGDSEHGELYSWQADQRDAVAVLDAIGSKPMPVLGHSKGGGVVLWLAEALPHRISHVINIDGLPSRRSWPDVSERDRTRLLASELAGWLDRRRTADDAIRKPGTADELAERRGRMNLRLPREWLRYLVEIGAREDPDGWRWKLDPVMRPGGFGPWRPEWSMLRLPALVAPVLAFLGLEQEPMGWGTRPEDVLPYLPAGATFIPMEGVGHFVHIEKPHEVAQAILEFLP